MRRRIIAQLIHLFRSRTRVPSALEQLQADLQQVQELYDRILQHYLLDRFGPDESRVARIFAEYNDWLSTAEMRFHVVSADEASVLIPIRLLDALAGELAIAPITVATPHWAVDEEVEARHRPSPGFRSIARSPDIWLRVLAHEHEVLRTLAQRHHLTDLGGGAI